jgi:small acid-soluble spore protein H (minor)
VFPIEVAWLSRLIYLEQRGDQFMDTKRAQEILESKSRIAVAVRGVPVWIDAVDAERSTARVHVEQNPEQHKTVAITELIEEGVH